MSIRTSVTSKKSFKNNDLRSFIGTIKLCIVDIWSFISPISFYAYKMLSFPPIIRAYTLKMPIKDRFSRSTVTKLIESLVNPIDNFINGNVTFNHFTTIIIQGKELIFNQSNFRFS